MQLPPRFLQSARLNLDPVSGEQAPKNTADANPICAWLLHNFLDYTRGAAEPDMPIRAMTAVAWACDHAPPGCGDAGKAHRMVVYDDAPHSFFDRTFADHRKACDDAWRQILAFVKENNT